MNASIELQVISRLLTSEDENEISTLCEYDESYYSVFKDQIHYILNHRQRYGNIPDVFTFQAEFPDITLVRVSEPLSFLVRELKKNKSRILLVETFNKITELSSDDAEDAWKYISMQCERASELDNEKPLDIVKDAKRRSEQIKEFSKQSRIPTGFAEIDQLMYGGLSTVEELLLIIARTNSGKSWVCTKMMESAQGHGFPVLYYSPEMQGSYLGTRFDTWRKHFQNSSLYLGKYTDEYLDYLQALSKEETSAYVLEDKDVSEGAVTVAVIEKLVKKLGIKLVVIDGLSYMADTRKSDTEYIRYKNICLDLFKLSKKYGCAVVVVMQANRETKDTKDDKGEVFPSLLNSEGSDHPGRICTQAFSMRQIFDKHVLDIRLEKSRMANNQKPVLSYSWDVNTGNMQYLPSEDENDPISNVISPKAITQDISKNMQPDASLIEDDDEDLDFDEDVEF